MEELRRLLATFSLITLMVCLGSESVYPQYFGRNKVQYESFDFQVMHTDHFDIYFYEKESRPIADDARMLERWYYRYSSLFNHELPDKQPVILYANHADFQQTNVIGGTINQGVGGFTEGVKNRVVIPLTGVYTEDNHVLGHELVHAFQYDILKTLKGGRSEGEETPLWLTEGMSEYLSLGRDYNLTEMWLRDAVLNDDIPSIHDVETNNKYFPYRYGHAILSYVGYRWGDRAVYDLFRSVSSNNSDTAYQIALGISKDSLSADWHDAVIKTYQPQLTGKTKPSEVGRNVISGEGGINLAPVISPDGKYIAYLSRRDLFTMDLYMADAETGKVVRKLASSSSDSHFDALRFINSSGAWSPDGSRFAFIVIKKGDNAIAILDVESGDIEQIIRLKSVGAISGLAWSPDGNRIALAGVSGGISDLFMTDINSGSLEKITDDKYADLQPDWSSDGSKLVFSTDRGSKTDFEELEFGSMKIGLMDLNTGDIQLVSISENAKHINPQFSNDDSRIYFISDPDGISNIYEYSLNTGEFDKLTNIATGICGLTSLSSAMSVANDTNLIAFSVFDDTEYNINILSVGEIQALAGTESSETNYIIAGNTNPGGGAVDEYLTSPNLGLPQGRTYEITKYNPSLMLLGLGYTSIGVTADRFGTSLGGATSAIFSDMLGNRMLGISAQLNGGLKDLGGQVVYQNRKRRLNWGGAVGHFPYQTGLTISGIDTVTINGQLYLADTQELILQRVFTERITLLTEYPLSTTRRLEFNAGYCHVSYDYESDKAVFVGNQLVSQSKSNIDGPSPLNLAQSSVAYVGDYSFFGLTSPVNGKRFRIEAEPTFGSLRYLTMLADYRHYFFLNPFTFALRGLHIGRYLKDSESDRLSALYLGFETLVRGYDAGSFNPSECSQGSDPGQCPEFDRLVGSRLAVFNAEFRVPLFGTERFGILNFPYLPTQISAFFDAGVAWNKGDHVKFEFVKRSRGRIPVFSAGMAARVNFLGLLIGQFYYAYPFQRPDAGWQFGFVISPGW